MDAADDFLRTGACLPSTTRKKSSSKRGEGVRLGLELGGCCKADQSAFAGQHAQLDGLHPYRCWQHVLLGLSSIAETRRQRAGRFCPISKFKTAESCPCSLSPLPLLFPPLPPSLARGKTGSWSKPWRHHHCCSKWRGHDVFRGRRYDKASSPRPIDPCSSDALRSRQNGDWPSGSTWSHGWITIYRIPDPVDVHCACNWHLARSSRCCLRFYDHFLSTKRTERCVYVCVSWTDRRPLRDEDVGDIRKTMGQQWISGHGEKKQQIMWANRVMKCTVRPSAERPRSSCHRQRVRRLDDSAYMCASRHRPYIRFSPLE